MKITGTRFGENLFCYSIETAIRALRAFHAYSIPIRSILVDCAFRMNFVMSRLHGDIANRHSGRYIMYMGNSGLSLLHRTQLREARPATQFERCM